MAALTIRNLPTGVHRALRLRAAQHGRSMEAEVRAILEATVQPPARPRLGSLLQQLGREAAIADGDVEAMHGAIAGARRAAPHEPVQLD
jgi:plasmid stability protein